MKKKLSLLMLAGLIAVSGLLLPVRPSHAFPQPAASSTAWHFDFTYSKPEPIALKAPDGSVTWYWYITYKVVNNTGLERLFIPEVTIATDRGDIITAGRGVPATAFAAIKDRSGKKLLENPIRVVGRILLGEDNARESVAVWPALDHDFDALTIFICGLSGESNIILNPQTHEPVTLCKTLMVEYAFPGTGGRPQDQAVLPRGETWVMR